MSHSAPSPFFPRHHRVPAQGWINDPNGIHKIGDEWHVFFQWNPHSARHSRINWGHAVSRDLVHWEERPAALVPREGAEDADGCWSGVGLVDEALDVPVSTLVYSAVSGENNQLATALVARADEAGHYTRFAVGAEVPQIPGLTGLRDPFVLHAEGHRFVVQGAGIRRDHGGVEAVLLGWLADDLENWVFLGEVASSADPVLRDMKHSTLWECPQLFPVGDEWVLIVGLWAGENEGTDLPVLQGSGYAVGRVSVEWAADGSPASLRFHSARAHGLVDNGPDFYAPQVFMDGERPLLWGWSWEGAERTQDETDALGWAGCLTLPRELRLEGDVLVSRLPEEVTAHGAELGVVSAERGVAVTVTGADGVKREVARADARCDIVVDGSIVEVLPESGTPTTVRAYGEIAVEEL